MGHDRECSRAVYAHDPGGDECVKCGAFFPHPEADTNDEGDQ